MNKYEIKKISIGIVSFLSLFSVITYPLNKKVNISSSNDNVVKKENKSIIDYIIKDSEELKAEKEEIKKEEETKKEIKEEIKEDNKKEETKKEETKEETKKEDIEETKEVVKEEPKKEEVTPEVKTMKDQNKELINKIYNTFGYRVSYNEESFWYGGMSSTYLTDENKAHQALLTLYNTSSLFPTNFFRTFQGYNGYRILLFEKINGAAGVASYEFGNDNLLALDVNQGFVGRTFFHETFHIMEKYIDYRTYGKANPFNNWNSYNPAGFNYGGSGNNNNTIWDYNFNTSSYNAPIADIDFVSAYSKSSAREDRAELFADLMFRPYKKDYMASGFGVNDKAKALSLILRNYFPNSAGARWEKWITW